MDKSPAFTIKWQIIKNNRDTLLFHSRVSEWKIKMFRQCWCFYSITAVQATLWWWLEIKILSCYLAVILILQGRCWAQWRRVPQREPDFVIQDPALSTSHWKPTTTPEVLQKKREREKKKLAQFKNSFFILSSFWHQGPQTKPSNTYGCQRHSTDRIYQRSVCLCDTF